MQFSVWVFKNEKFVYKTASIMSIRFYKTLIFVIVIYPLQSGVISAEELPWNARIGPITVDQETEIELFRHNLVLTDFRTITVGENLVNVFDAKAEFVLKNSSSSKKKPTIRFPLCKVLSGEPEPPACDPKKIDLKILTDGIPVSSLQVVKHNQIFFVRFTVKFEPKQKRLITASYKFFERQAAVPEIKKKRVYTVFDYHMEDATKWRGKVAFSGYSIKMPYKATFFNTHLSGVDKPFRYKNRVAYLEQRRLTPDNVKTMSFYIASMNYVDKVKQVERKVKALPSVIKRRLKLISLLLEYPGASSDIAKHVDIILRSEAKEWDAAKRKHTIEVFNNYLAEAARFEDDGVNCTELICVEKQNIFHITKTICENDVCFKEQSERFTACCDRSPTRLDSADETKDIVVEQSPSAVDDAQNVTKENKQPLLSRYLEYLISHWPIFLAILIVTGWIGVSSRNKKKPQMKELE